MIAIAAENASQLPYSDRSPRSAGAARLQTGGLRPIGAILTELLASYELELCPVESMPPALPRFAQSPFSERARVAAGS
jgi:hypothetical protein